ncbi:GH16 domain-containing protein [Favolaschia claudopus]|uniref:GH16 domain-containing protein n=1 Tax=Favolaschia claudopus TaxID=2862362 RepID=A0AAW0CWB0_9AGAR
MANFNGAYAPLQNSSTPNLATGFPRDLSRQNSGNSSYSGVQPSFARRPNEAPSLRGNDAGSLPQESRYMLPSAPGRNRPSSLQPSISEKFHLAPDPAAWGSDITHAEADDALHDPRHDKKSGNIFTGRGFENVGCIALLCIAIVGLFLGYPVTSHFTNPTRVSELHINATGQMPNIGNWGLIDSDTPKDVYKIHAYHDPSETLQLVFSDEFETEGRSFYPGDDPYWEAVDLNYWATRNLEWYDPSAITTRNGALEINLTKVEDPTQNHNLNYKGGMMATWNKFCFTGGLIVSNVMLPGATNVFGLWPAVWTMGNLGRAGYGATLDGMWPYVYDSCDVGTLKNQTLNGGPPAALHSGGQDDDINGELSYLPGQRLSRCTCPGESHPGPMHGDGSYVGRSAPEIDVIEAQIGGPDGAHVGQVSQSAQWAPFNAGYIWNNSTQGMNIVDLKVSHQNSYSGGVFQQATSVVSTTNQDCYQQTKQCFSVQGFEYVPGYDEGYITWITDSKITWTLFGAGVTKDDETQIAARPITDEPLYILINLGISHAFGFVDFEHIIFPATMRIDWVRVYQHPDRINIGCDPPEKPTAAYIEAYKEAYLNYNLTTWVDDYGQKIPKNKLVDQC